MTTRYERMKMQRRMQRRIQMVVEERRIALSRPAEPVGSVTDPEATMEIRPSVELRAIGRVAVRPA